MKDIFDFNIGIKKNLLYLFLGGLFLCLIGVYQLINSGHSHEESSEIVLPIFQIMVTLNIIGIKEFFLICGLILSTF